MGRLQIHPGGLIMNLFGLIVWVIALGGCGAATYQCNQNTADAISCSKIYQWEWWSLWLEFFLLFALFISSFLESYNRGRMVFLAYFTMATVLTMWSAHNFINAAQIGKVPTDLTKMDKTQAAINAGAAGFVLVSIANFAILIVLGKDFAWQPHSSLQAQQQPYVQQSHQFAGAAVGAAPQV